MLPPSPALRPFVRCYAQRTVSGSEPSVDAHVEAIPARLEQTLEFQLGKSFDVAIPGKALISAPQVVIVGAYLGRCALIRLVPGVLSFCVFFLPTGLSRLFGIPVSEFTGRNFDATLVLTGLRELRTRLGESGSFADRVRLVEHVLLRFAARSARKNQILDVAEFAFARRGAVSIDKLAQTTGLGFRQFERRFCEGLGTTPKLFARVARFQSAVDAKISAPHRTWLEIAHELEYHDQMHMIHDFKDFTGHSPAQLLPQIGDGRPSAFMSNEITENSKLWC
ncbi:helix-turn-helix domain-containing protein [Acidicapsa acidisoli]|uniref:helix-turn-helix domain-containing protein n=1 Tax=Acidicapsa acidisoli TaxID=1615681 RepID=UPI0021E05D8A|nr:AraC family transcriptional regulator [Acidicapsa acidisoli]